MSAPAGRRITVTARRAGFRRGGRAWAGTPTTVAASEFTREQLAAIEAEPMLIVTSEHAREGVDPAPGSEDGAGDPAALGADPAAGSDPAAGDPARDQAIAAAMDRLDPDDSAHYRADGRPEVGALRRAGAPPDTTAADRDRVWAAIRGD